MIGLCPRAFEGDWGLGLVFFSKWFPVSTLYLFISEALWTWILRGFEGCFGQDISLCQSLHLEKPKKEESTVV